MFRVFFVAILITIVYANRKPRENSKSSSNVSPHYRQYDAAMRHKIQMNICREKHREKMCRYCSHYGDSYGNIELNRAVCSYLTFQCDGGCATSQWASSMSVDETHADGTSCCPPITESSLYLTGESKGHYLGMIFSAIPNEKKIEKYLREMRNVGDCSCKIKVISKDHNLPFNKNFVFTIFVLLFIISTLSLYIFNHNDKKVLRIQRSNRIDRIFRKTMPDMHVKNDLSSVQ